MKDRQVEQAAAQPRIPVLSPLLHFVAMTVVVYLRSSFGFAYLRPRSVFLAFAWACLLFDIYAWLEPGVWAKYWPVCVFASGAAILYMVHLCVAFFGQLYERGEHDNHSGTSHVMRLARRSGKAPAPRFEMNLHLWFEPAAVLLLAAVLRVVFGEGRLSAWLFFAAICLTLKEAQNYWFRLRQQKRQQDIFGDTEDAADPTIGRDRAAAEAPRPTRKARTKRTRAAGLDEAAETRFAETLRLLPPYSLEQAEQNYRSLIRNTHPDTNESSAENTARSAALNEAIEYFRERLPG